MLLGVEQRFGGVFYILESQNDGGVGKVRLGQRQRLSDVRDAEVMSGILVPPLRQIRQTGRRVKPEIFRIRRQLPRQNPLSASQIQDRSRLPTAQSEQPD